MFRLCSYFILILLFSSIILSQVVTVKDKNTEEPLGLVSVYNGDINKSLITDSKGRVKIGSLDKDKVFVFRLIGYEKKELSYDELKANNFEIFLAQQPIALGDLVVSAKRWEEDRAEIPHSIELITPREVELQNPQTTADMLIQSGNVYVQKSQLGGGSPMIRGFATNRVLIVVDNIRMNTAIFRSGNLQNVISLDANSLSNAQVMFGPASVMYGSDAIGGVMEFNTETTQFSYSNEIVTKGEAFGRYSSANNEKTGHFNFSLGLDEWSFLTSFTYSDFGNLTMGSNGPDDYLRTFYQDRINGKDTAIINDNPKKQISSGYDQFNVMQKIRFKPDENWEFNYGFHYSTTSDVPRYDRLIEFQDGKPRSAQWYYGPQKWMMNNLSLTNFTSNSFYDLSKLIIAFQNFEESRHDRKFRSNLLRHRTETVDAFSVNLDFIKRINQSSQLYYGVETVFNSVGSEAESEDIESGEKFDLSTRYPDGSNWNSYGIYAMYKNKLSEKYILQTGLRYNLVSLHAPFDTTFFSFPFSEADLTTGALTGSAGLVWHPQEDLQINLSLSTGFRAPNIDDAGKVFDSEPGSVIVPNPNLKSEYIYTIELGLMKTFWKKIKIELAGFYSYLDDALVRRNYQLAGKDSIIYDGTLSQVQAIQNAAFAYVSGIQAGITYNFLNYFEFVSDLTYQQGTEEDDNGNEVPLRHSPPWYGSTKLIYNKGKFNAVVYADYNGELGYEDLAPSEQDKPHMYALDENGNPYSPSWYTLNFKFGISLFNNYQINLGIENITDQRYQTYSSGIAAPGRNFIGSVRIGF